MRKLSLITLALMTLLFSQCKKDKIEDNVTETRLVKVRCEIPMGGGSKTDFTNLLADGSINWSQGVEESVYVTIPGETPQIVKLTGNSDGSQYLTFEGTIDPTIISAEATYDLWYLGNGTVTENTERGIMTSVSGSIAEQNASLESLGSYHIAKVEVSAYATYDEEGNETVVLNLDGTLRTQIAIAYMDLTDVTVLSGDAIVGNAYTISCTDGTFKFELSGEQEIEITDGTSESFVVLFPNESCPVTIKSDNSQQYTFENGIEANTLYNSENGTLEWDEIAPNIDGYEYVDLGLPSKTLWAKYNVNASDEPETAADYQGIKHEWMSDLNESGIYSESWSVPTKDQMSELIENCSQEYVEDYENIEGNDGVVFTSNINQESIFLPFPSEEPADGEINGYWSGTKTPALEMMKAEHAWYMYYSDSNNACGLTYIQIDGNVAFLRLVVNAESSK